MNYNMALQYIPSGAGGQRGASAPTAEKKKKHSDNVPFFSKSHLNMPFFENIKSEIVSFQ